MRANVEAGLPILKGIEKFVFYGDLIDSNKASTFDANSLFRELLKDYPDTILLLNLRNREDWIRSRLRHGHGEFAAREQAVRGLPTQDALVEQWRREWDQHLAAVRGFMVDRPAQLLEFNLDHDRIEELVARLPAYHLQARYFEDIGRTRGRHLPAWIEALKTWIAYRKPRTQR